MPYSEKFEEALIYAHQVHRNQRRKASEIPYIHHLLSVAALVGEYGGDEEQVIAGLLHDAIEDGGGQETAQEIERRFGLRVRTLVEGCSDTDQTPKPPWQARKEAYIQHLRTVEEAVLLVSAADKLHNCRSIVIDLEISGERVWSRFSGGKGGTLWYYRSILSVYQSRWTNPIVQELAFTVDRMERLSS